MSKLQDWFFSLFFKKITINQETGEGIEKLPEWWQRELIKMGNEQIEMDNYRKRLSSSSQPKTFTEEEVKLAFDHVMQMIEYKTEYKYWKNPMYESIKLLKEKLNLNR